MVLKKSENKPPFNGILFDNINKNWVNSYHTQNYEFAFEPKDY